MTEKQVELKIESFVDGVDSHDGNWKIEKRLFDEEQIQTLRAASKAGDLIRFSIEGPARSGWAFLAKAAELKNQFHLQAQTEQKHFNHIQSEKLAKESVQLEPFSFITIGNKLAIVSHVHDNGTFQIVYEQSPGKHIAEDAKFDGEKYVFCISGPCGSYADNNSHYAPFIQALKRRYK